MSDIKQRLLNESFKGQEAMRREAITRIEALEVQVGRLKTPAKECYHEEGCPHWVEVVARNDALRVQLAVAREALEKAEYASRKDSLTESERLSCVRTVVCAAISKLALGKDTQ